MNPITTIIVTVLGNAIVTGIIVYFIQKKFEAKLQKSLFEHQTKFSRTYPKTLEVLETLHQKLLNYSSSCSVLMYQIESKISGWQAILSDEEFRTKEQDLLTKFAGCSAYLDENRIYIPDRSIGELENIINELHALDFYRTVCTSFLEQPAEDFPILVRDVIAGRYSLSFLRFINESPFQNINPKDKDAPIILIRTIRDKVNKLPERLEKLYKSVAETR